MAKSKVPSKKLNANRLVMIVVVIVLLIFAILVGQQIIELKDRHSAPGKPSGPPTLVPPTNITNS